MQFSFSREADVKSSRFAKAFERVQIVPAIGRSM